MSRYRLVDEDGSFYDIADKTFSRKDDNLDVELDIIERSFQAGAEFPGVQRDESKEITFEYQLNKNTDPKYRDYMNNFQMWLRKVRLLQDLDTNTQIQILMKNHKTSYDTGGYLRGAGNSVTFVQLKPYWEDIEYTIEGESGNISNQILTIINDGFIETPPIIIVYAAENVTKFSIVLNQNMRGIVIQDLQFGTNGLNLYILDNGAGTVELNQIDRKNKVRLGTGPFNLLVGRNDLIINSDGLINVQIQWKRRYYV